MEDLVTVELGAGDLAPIEIMRGSQIGDVPDLEICPSTSAEVSDGRGGTITVEVMPVSGGCMIRIIEPDRVIFDEMQAQSASDELNGRDVDGVEEAAVRIERFRLLDMNGSPYPVGTEASALSVRVDDQVVLTEADLAQVETGTVRVTLSEDLLQKLRDGVRNETAVTATVAIELVYPLADLPDVPSFLEIDARLQPIVTVDVIDAAI